MDPKLSITRKTYYALGLLAAACLAAGAFCVLIGQPLALLDSVAFALTGMMFLLLAAVKGSPKQDKKRYFACFLLLILSACGLPAPAARLLAASYWPLFLWVEVLRGSPAKNAARLLTACELLACLFWLGVSAGGLEGLTLVANLFWLLTTLTRGGAALVLYRAEANRTE